MRTYSVPLSLAVAGAIGVALWVALEVVPARASRRAPHQVAADVGRDPARRPLWTLVASLAATTAISLIVVTRNPSSLAHAVSLGLLALLVPVAATTAHALRTNQVGASLRRNAVIVVAGALVAALTYTLGR